VDVDETPASLDALVDELLDADGEREVAFRDGARHVARLARYEAPAAPLGGSPYRLESAERGSFDRLGIVPAPHRSPGPGEVEIAIAATALNFADVMDALGVRPGGASEFGGECAGRIVAVGDGVDGFAPGDDVVALADGCFGSHVTCPAALVWRRPPALSAEQAAALPIAFVTARYALHEIGRLERGERVLVHAGAGGVGLAAVQLARRAGAELFVTAGSAEKRAYLASLGITHVFNSRTTAFAEEIRQRTDGRGVDVVLNSLAGSFIPATLGAVAPGGRFLEIGKTGWSPEQVTAARPDVEYHVLDWWPIKHTDPARIRVLVERTLDDLAAGAIDPLPVTTFPVEESPSAFRFMAQARHIGKVVVRHGPQPHAIDPAGSYLVTGGLSGLGLLVAEWLADRGATSIVVMGRREPSPEARATLEGLEQRGTRITVVRGDVSVRADVEALFRRLADLPPLRGVMHAAGVLADGALLQQDWPRFWEPMAPKVAGTEHLQAALAGRPVDLFVMFSSVASVLGSAGQGNHAAANSFMDALAHERRRRGLPALDINWGVWSDVGAAVRSGADRRASEQGLGLIDPSAGLRMLDTLIRGDAIQATACPVDWARFGERYPAGRVPPLVSGLVAAPARPVQRKAAPAPAASAILRELDATPPAGRPRALLNHVRGQAQQVLGLPPSRAIDVRQPLNELGLDSLLAVELRNLISGALGRPLPATLLFDYPTIEALAGYLGREVLGLASAPDEAGPPPEAPAGVVERLEELSDEEVDRLLAERVARKPK
jgi:NADPH:quinone reductase-like Zn-dependent oxidoreductase/acyl carrier protein